LASGPGRARGPGLRSVEGRGQQRFPPRRAPALLGFLASSTPSWLRSPSDPG
jgi:hypothetical protein